MSTTTRTATGTSATPVPELIARSNRLGSDPRNTNYAGGNTSAKGEQDDPVTDEPVELLWVKGSGGDLGTLAPAGLAVLRLDRVRSLVEVYPGVEHEDEMVAAFDYCLHGKGGAAPSIDTAMHALVDAAHVDHLHADSGIALATAVDGEALTAECFGDRVVWVPWRRPGFQLGLDIAAVKAAHPQAIGVILGGHGITAWGDSSEECEANSLHIIRTAEQFIVDRGAPEPFGPVVPGREALPEQARRDRAAALFPLIRGLASTDRAQVGHFTDSDVVLDFLARREAPELVELGTSCPDHFLRTKIKPLYVDWDPASEDVAALQAKLEAGLARYREDYTAYYEACRRPDSPAMRGGDPTVILVPGLGIIGWGKSKSESRVTAEFYKCAIEVMRGAEAVSRYTALPRQEAFDIEYWALEEAKLRRMPPEKELARQIVAVVGAGSGIGRAVTNRLVSEGAVVAALDLKPEAAKETADIIMARIGMGIGVAGSGLSGAGDVIALGMDMTRREEVRRALEEIVYAYGGLDHVVVTAGLYVSPDTEGRIPDAGWEDSFRVNVIGPHTVADEAARVWAAQDLQGSMVLTTSVNAVVPKKGSFAYDTSKAAANHLIRELAVALAPKIRVNGVAPATVVEGSAMFPRDRVIASLAKYGLSWSDDETDEALRDRLAGFYAQRTLTRQAITPADQAEAVFLLVSRRLGKTTGQVINVDGGLDGAFLR